MAVRTYLPKLQMIAHLLCRYVARYETQIRANLSSENEVILDAALVACAALDAMLETVVPPVNSP